MRTRATLRIGQVTSFSAVVLALVAVLVCLALPFHAHSGPHSSDSACAVCHVADSPAHESSAIPSVSAAAVSQCVHPVFRSLFASRSVSIAPSRGPPSLLLA